MTEARIRALLGRPELRALFMAVRDALEARGAEQARSVTLGALSPEERRAIADLHGWPEVPAGERVRISLSALDSALRESAAGSGLEEVVVALSGPLVDRRGARADARAMREQLWARAREHPAVRQREELRHWLEELRGHGLVARAAKGTGTPEAVLLERVLTVVARLPAPGILLPVLATEALGDAHALDVGRAEAGLVLRAAAALAGWTSMPAGASERRRLWAEVGVACDPLSADVLTLGLRPLGEELLARHLREASAQGEPRRMTLRELMRGSVTVPSGMDVFVCENPSVVAAAADQLGGRCRPLVCVEGVPSTASLQLLRSLSLAGAVIRFHADFDWAGLRIANLLAGQLPSARPWRMGTSDYESAAEGGGALLELSGEPVPALWDASLAHALSRHRLALPEERVLGNLLLDLRHG